MRRTIPLRERFLAKVQKTDKCWNWMGTKNSDGYGCIADRGKTRNTHRVAYELFVGPIPEGKWVLHRCDNPNCVNPSHLILGSNAENQADAEAKGRGRRGERNARAKLTWPQVQEIRAQYRPHSHIFDMRALGRRYGVSHTEICDIIHTHRWKDEQPRTDNLAAVPKKMTQRDSATQPHNRVVTQVSSGRTSPCNHVTSLATAGSDEIKCLHCGRRLGWALMRQVGPVIYSFLVHPGAEHPRMFRFR